jgi:hypothetical protein
LEYEKKKRKKAPVQVKAGVVRTTPGSIDEWAERPERKKHARPGKKSYKY